MFKYAFSVIGIIFSLSSWCADAMGLDSDTIRNAQGIPAQYTLGVERSWSCGPNSLARFLSLSGYEFGHQEKDYYVDFMNQCPRSFGKPTTTKGYISCASAAAISLACMCYGWDGYSDVVSGLIFGAAAATPFVVEGINKYRGVGKVGPTPKWLAGYGNKFLRKNSIDRRLRTEKFTDEDHLIETIKATLNNHKPVIVLVNFAPLAWHYINLISFDETSNKFEYLETNGSIYEITTEKLIKDMDFDKNTQTKAIKCGLETLGACVDVDIGRFNLIRWVEHN